MPFKKAHRYIYYKRNSASYDKRHYDAEAPGDGSAHRPYILHAEEDQNAGGDGEYHPFRQLSFLFGIYIHFVLSFPSGKPMSAFLCVYFILAYSGGGCQPFGKMHFLIL